MTTGRCPGAMNASACGTRSLSALAPRLPPTTSSRSGPERLPRRCCGPGCCRNSARSGLPIQRAFVSTCGKALNTRSATPARTRLAIPATEFCSCSTSGLPSSTLIMPAGKLMYPPSPITTSGCTRRTTWMLCQKAFSSRSGNSTSVVTPLPRTPEKSTVSKANPRAGTSRLSMLSGPPSQCTRHDLSRKACATARPGKMWPPVPPAMTSAHRVMCGPRASATGSRSRCAAPLPTTPGSSGSPSRHSS